MKRNSTPIIIGFVSFLIATTVGFASVNTLSISLIPYIRVAALAISIICILLHVLSVGIIKSTAFSVAVVILLSIVALASGPSRINRIDLLPDVLVSTGIVILGIIYFRPAKDANNTIAVAQYFVIFSYIVIIFLITTNGLEINRNIRFNYDIRTEAGSLIRYSQGASKFFGLAAVASAWLASKAISLREKLLFWLSLLIFTGLAFIGGGRGDFLALLILIVGLTAFQNWRGAILAAAPIVLIHFFGIQLLQNLSGNVVAADRFLALLQGDTVLGTRDILFRNAIELIANEPRCFLVGCGYTYFQDYYGYSYGLYPHNFLLEAVIVWGAPLVFISATFFVVGFLTKPQNDFITWAGLFFVLIAMKSGDVIGSWFALSFLYYHIGVGLFVTFGGVKSKQQRVYGNQVK